MSELYLAFDYGAKRVGVAMGDATIGIAHPVKTVAHKNSRSLMNEINVIVGQWSPVALVVGMPHHDHDKPHPLEKRVRRFCKTLELTFELTVFTVDESYTSVDADQFLVKNRVKREKRKELIDMLAAQLILEDFFATTLKKKERRD